MKVPRTKLAVAIAEATLNERDHARLARAVAAYLLSENRVSELEPLMRDVLAYRQQRGIIEANAMSAHELSAEANREVKDLLKQHYPKAKKVIVHDAIEPELIGGVKLQLANEQLDMSVRARLDTFKRLTTGGNL